MADRVNEYIVSFINYCYENHITFTSSDEFDPFTPSQAYPALRQIIINTNWYDHIQIPYTIAHEIGHVQNNDAGVLYFTPTKTRFESAADRYAVRLLVPMYHSDVEPEFANVHRFMSALHIPACMEEYSSKMIESYYDKD